MADLLVEINGGGSYELRSFPADRKRIDIGDYYSDCRRIESVLGWTPKVPLREALTRTLEFYRQHLRTATCERSRHDGAIAHPADRSADASYLAHQTEIDDAVSRALESGCYILGAEVAAFEREFAAYLGVAEAIGVGPAPTRFIWRCAPSASVPATAC